MKVKDLIVLLQAQDQEREIYGYEPFDGNGGGSICEPEVGENPTRTGRTEPCDCDGGVRRGVSVQCKKLTYKDDEVVIGSVYTTIKDIRCGKCRGDGKREITENKLFVGWF